MKWDSQKEAELKELRKKELKREERLDDFINFLLATASLSLVFLGIKELVDIIKLIV